MTAQIALLNLTQRGTKMKLKHFPSPCIMACAALAAVCLPLSASAQPVGVEAQADKVFRAMTTYVAGLKQFSARVENTIEAVTTDLQKIQFVAPASITVSRPDKLIAQRHGDIVDQSFFYDGKSLTLFNPGTKHYATVAAPANIDAMIDFARSKLDVIAPGGDLIAVRAYETLMQDVTSGAYLGLEVVMGQRCHHLAYRATEVDWQVWVREGDRPLPCRYVITSKGVVGAPQFTMQVLDWNTNPKITEGMFRFVPPAGAKPVDFLPASPAR
jgi:hypothetical protein